MRNGRVLLLLLPWVVVGAGADRIVLREPAPVPERYRAPLPARLDLAELSSSERLRSNGLMRLPGHHQIAQELCRGEGSARSRVLGGLERALAEPGQPLRTAYLEILGACSGAAHCAWLASRARASTGTLREILWGRAALCWPSGDPGPFESEEVPDAAVISFHAARRLAEPIHSPRLARIVEARAAAGDAASLEGALRAYERMDHPETAARLLRLHAAATDPEIARLLASALRFQSDPAAAGRFESECRRELAERMRSRPAAGSDPRASPFRRGDPCGASTLSDREGAPGSLATPGAPDPLARVRPLGRVEWLNDVPETTLGDQSLLLRRLVALVAPDLDEAVLEDVWPAVDAVSLARGPFQVQVFVEGDAVLVGVPGRRGEPDRAVAEAIRADLETALRAPRAFDVWLRGERIRFRYQPEDRRAAALEIANWLLERAGSERRVARVVTEFGLAVLAGSPAAIERGAAEGLLEAAP